MRRSVSSRASGELLDVVDGIDRKPGAAAAALGHHDALRRPARGEPEHAREVHHRQHLAAQVAHPEDRGGRPGTGATSP